MLLLPICLLAQTTVYKFAPKSNIKVEGTSTMHDWSMLSSSLQGDAEFVVEAGKLTNIKNLKLTLPAESLKSGKNAMDKNAYEALKTGKHQNIQFKLTNLSNINQSGNEGVMTINGMLTIAGVTKPEKIDVKYTIDNNGVLNVQGKKEFKMSTYGITPPSFMFGSVTTGDAVTISFNVLLNPTQQIPQ